MDSVDGEEKDGWEGKQKGRKEIQDWQWLDLCHKLESVGMPFFFLSPSHNSTKTNYPTRLLRSFFFLLSIFFLFCLNNEAFLDLMYCVFWHVSSLIVRLHD